MIQQVLKSPINAISRLPSDHPKRWVNTPTPILRKRLQSNDHKNNQCDWSLIGGGNIQVTELNGFSVFWVWLDHYWSNCGMSWRDCCLTCHRSCHATSICSDEWRHPWEGWGKGLWLLVDSRSCEEAIDEIRNDSSSVAWISLNRRKYVIPSKNW